MPIYLVQHGKALPKEIDEKRPLSPEGRTETEVIAHSLNSKGVKVKQVCHCGKRRAKETAEILAAKIAEGKTVKIFGINPNDNVKEFAERIKNNCMYVGHLPHLEKLVSFLITEDSDTEVLKFTNSGVLCLEKTNNNYHIQWYVVP